MKEGFGQITPPFRMIESPGLMVAELHTPVQVCIPGACCHGLVFEVPLLESLPLA
jgi:hypothetical protein